MTQPERLLDIDQLTPPPAIPRAYPRSICKRCGKRVAWAVLLNALNEVMRHRDRQPVKVPLDVHPTTSGKLRLIEPRGVREVTASELWLGDRFQRHVCKRGKR